MFWFSTVSFPVGKWILFGTLETSIFPVVSKSAGKKLKIIKDKRKFLREISTKLILVFGVTLKNIILDTYMKLSLNVNITILYIPKHF